VGTYSFASLPILKMARKSVLLQKAAKVLRHLAENFDFRASWKHLTFDIFLFFRLQRLPRLHKIELERRPGISEN